MDRLKKAADQESQQNKQDKCKRKQDQTRHKGNFSREGLACQLREPHCGILHIPEGDIDGDHQTNNCQNLSDYTVSETENREKYQCRQYTEVQQVHPFRRPSSSLTRELISDPSARPFSSLTSGPITRPISDIPEAPSSSIFSVQPHAPPLCPSSQEDRLRSPQVRPAHRRPDPHVRPLQTARSTPCAASRPSSELRLPVHR